MKQAQEQHPDAKSGSPLGKLPRVCKRIRCARSGERREKTVKVEWKIDVQDHLYSSPFGGTWVGSSIWESA